MAGFLTLKASLPWPWPWIGSYCILSCITYRLLPTYEISLKLKKLFVDERTYARTYARTDGRTFETGFIRSTLSKSRPNNKWWKNFDGRPYRMGQICHGEQCNVVFNCWYGLEGHCMSLCQISCRSVKPLRRFAFFIFQDGGRPPSWIF